MHRLFLTLGLIVATACASPHRDPVAPDTGGAADTDDTTTNDTATLDTSGGAVDAGALDAGNAAKDSVGAVDVASDTAATKDAGSTKDGGSSDTTAGDTAKADVPGTSDAGSTDAGAVDAGGEATACFVGAPPGIGAKILDVPKGKTTCPSFDKPFIGLPGVDYGKPTITVEAGYLDDKHAFVPYKDGDFTPIRPGAQPGFHLWTAFRVKVPGATTNQVKLEVLARGLMNCEAKAMGALPTYYATKDPKLPNTYVYKTTLAPGLPVIFLNTTVGMAGQFCGKWLDLRVQVLQHGTKNWGKSQVLLRIWDGVTKK